MPQVDLDPDLHAFVQEQIRRGRFQSAEDVVRAGLRLLEDQETELAERLASVRDRINQSLNDPRPSVPADDVFARLERKHTARLNALRRES